MLTDFIVKKLTVARFKLLSDGSYFGEIPGIRGVWANAKTLSACQNELREVLEDWIVVSLKKDKKIPGLSFDFDKRNLIKNA